MDGRIRHTGKTDRHLNGQTVKTDRQDRQRDKIYSQTDKRNRHTRETDR